MSFYKYYPPESVSFILTPLGISLRFSQPSTLNDPFELAPHISDLTDAEKNEISKGVRNTFHLHTISTGEGKNNRSEQSLLKIENFVNELQNDRKQRNFSSILSEKYGVLSLCKDGFSRTMWSYYSNNHTGFLVEIDVNKLPIFSKANVDYIFDEVNYVTERPKDLEDTKDNRRALFLSKDIAWKHEQEWRVVTELQNIKHINTIDNIPIHCDFLNAQNIKAVILGVNSSEELRQKILTWKKHFAPNVEIKKSMVI